MKFLKSIFITLFIITPLSTYAFDKSTLIMTVVNQSSQTLTYAGVDGYNPGNQFSVSPTVMEPGEGMTIVGDVTERYSLIGQLHFTDSHQTDNVLVVLDKLQFKQGSAVFSMNNARFISTAKYKTFNPLVNPLALLYTGVEVIIKDNNNPRG